VSSTPSASAPAPSATPPRPAQAPAPGTSYAGVWRRLAFLVVLIAIAGSAFVFLARWIDFRGTHSITDDAFVESHIVNIAPEMVSGRIIRFLVEENDRVESGQVLAEVDPVPYQDKVDVARSKHDSAAAELARQRADLDRVRKEVPIQVEIARRTLASAEADRGRAQASLEYTIDEVEKSIDEARAGLKAARADLTLAQEEYGRFTRLYRQEASTQRRAQEVTRSHDAAQAQVDLAEARLAKALASRTQIDVARRALEAAQAARNKAEKSVDLSQTGYDQIREIELLVKVKEQTLEESRRALRAAEHDLEYTQIRAPFPGVVVKRYRNLGDFASAGVSVLSMYNPELLYVEANLEETRLPGVAPGNRVEIEVDAFSWPFRGRVVWINKSTGAQFALMPRNVVSGEFTRVVQRVPVRIQIERDDRWPQLRAGLSARVAIAHGSGDAGWANEAARAMAELETRYNASQSQPEPAAKKDSGRVVPAVTP
jgi:membrane fusion protein (multidrug efflux system)